MSRTNYIFCLMNFYLFSLVIYHVICLHRGMTRDGKRTSPKPWLPGYVRRRTITVISTSHPPITVISTSDPPTPSMAPLSSTIKNTKSNTPVEHAWTMAVCIIMSLAIVALLVGIQLTTKSLWDKRQEPPNTEEEEPWTSSHDTVD